MKMSFYRNEGQENKTGPVWEGRRHKERVKEGEYGGNMTHE
jgi:hypothetical protein